MSEKILEQWKQTTIINLYKGKGDTNCYGSLLVTD